MVPTFFEPEKQPLKELEGSPNEGGTCSNTPTTCSTDIVTHSQATCSTDVHSHMTRSTDISCKSSRKTTTITSGQGDVWKA